jgi:hypothetical protein
MYKIVFWANCQSGSIHYMFNKYFHDIYKIYHFLNYEYIKNNKELPDEIADADFFIYQNYSKQEDPTYSLDNIINMLKPECKKICIPFLQCDSLFCYNSVSPHNSKTITQEFPHGKFFYGIEHIENELKLSYNSNKETIISNAYKNMTDDQAIPKETIDKYKYRNLEYFENKILSSDVPELFNFIQNNFTKVRLFYNRNHPTGLLLNELVKGVFRCMNLEYPSNDPTNIIVLDDILNDWCMPILPCVQKYYQLEFDCKVHSKYHPNIIDLYSFIETYVDSFFIYSEGFEDVHYKFYNHVINKEDHKLLIKYTHITDLLLNILLIILILFVIYLLFYYKYNSIHLNRY